jgi:hypothetical protein
MATKPKKSSARETAAAETPEAAPTAPALPGINLDKLADLQRENLAAFTKANLALSEGLRAINKEVLSYAKASFENASRNATALLGAKTLDEVIKINSDHAKTSIETLLARSAKLSEMGVSLASQAMAPLGGRVEAALAKITKSASA